MRFTQNNIHGVLIAFRHVPDQHEKSSVQCSVPLYDRTVGNYFVRITARIGFVADSLRKPTPINITQKKTIKRVAAYRFADRKWK